MKGIDGDIQNEENQLKLTETKKQQQFKTTKEIY